MKDRLGRCCGMVLILTLWLSVGCTALTPKEQVMVSARTDVEYLRQDVDKLKQRLEAIEAEQEEFRREIQLSRRSVAEGQTAMREQVAQVNRSLRAIDAARKKDVEDIVARLSKKIVHAINSQRSSGDVYDAETGQHVVQKGETLSGIAGTYDVTVSALMRANGLKKANLIRVGQKLDIPQ